MNLKKEYTSTLGLLLITIWAAMQYIFLQNVPDSVSTFSFIFITNLVGLVILALVQYKKLKLIHWKIFPKGMLLAGELIGFNFFLIPGSRGLDSVVSSSLVSMYFVFVTPMLLLLKKKVSFRSAVASAVAIIALLLIFEANIESIFSSINVIFLLIADLFFAAYVITVSEVGANEDSYALTVSQMIFSIIFSLGFWIVESALGHASFSFPNDNLFWFSVVFFGVFIRGCYSLIQVSCQKYVKPVNASLIFSSEIIITLITRPLLAHFMNTQYTPATGFQIIGCVLFVIAVIVVDDTVMSRIGYTDMEVRTYVDENGVLHTQSTLSRKLTNMTLVISMTALLVSTVVCIGAISSIRNTAVNQSTKLGHTAADVSEKALKTQLELELINKMTDKALLAEAKLMSYVSSVLYAADTAGMLYDNPDINPEKEVMYPLAENAGVWVMTRVLADHSIPYDEKLRRENCLLGNMETIFRSIIDHNVNIATIYIGTETGLLVSYDPGSSEAATGGESYYEFRNAGWYIMGKQARKPFFTRAYQDSYGRGLTLTCVAPVRDSSGTFRGCIGLDVLINDLNQSMINDKIVDPDYATLINNEGFIIADKNVDRQASGTTTIYDEGANESIREAAQTILSHQNGITSIGSGDDSIYIAYSEIPLTDWKLCIISPVLSIIRPAIDIRNDIDTNTVLVAGTVNNSIGRIVNSCLVMSAMILLVITYVVGKTSEKITTPLRHLEEDVLEISQGKFERRTQVSTNDEIGSLALAFNHMTQSLQNYIVDLKDMTAKEERIASELSVATEIQTNILPKNFSELERNEFDIYATMTPAKEVGGDFYDCFLIDENHLAMVIADVSGKGIPAALFMMISKTLLKSAAQSNLSPKEVLEKVNAQLCENNDAEMFVTVWLGILEISSGKLVCANAGHEYPAILRNGGEFELFKDEHGFVLAGMEDTRYQEYEMTLNPGDQLFVYTDGVAEAADTQHKLYGTARMIAALNRHKSESCEALLHSVKAEIDSFVGDAPQFDDITMLCLKLNAAGSDKNKNIFLKVEPTLKKLEEVTASLESLLKDADVPMKIIRQMNLATDEIFSNIVRYSGAHEVEIQCSFQDNKITLAFTDDGKPYDPTGTPEPDITLTAEDRNIGGLGIFMVKKFMDSINYKQHNGKNILTLVKSI